MTELTDDLLALMTEAAHQRATGVPWVRIGELLNRSPDTVRQWPRRYPDVWRQLFRAAEGETSQGASGEVHVVMRNLMLTSENEAIRVAAGSILDRRRAREQAAEARQNQAALANVPPEALRVIVLLMEQDHVQFQKQSRAFLLRNPPPTDLAAVDRRHDAAPEDGPGSPA